jgi:hypothetical protein
VSGIGVEEAAAVVADKLDRLLAGHRPDRHHLFSAFERRGLDRSAQCLRDAQGGESERNDKRERQQDVEGRARHIDPEVPNRRRLIAGEPADQGDRNRDRGGRIQEIVGGEAHHLRQVAQRRLAAVGLPVRIGDEALDRAIAAAEFEEAEVRGKGIVLNAV